MSILKIIRTKETYREKIRAKTEGTQINIFKSINNFETYCMEKHGKPNIIPELKELEGEEIYDVLQAWINWNSRLAASSVRVHFSNVKKYLHYLGIKLYKDDIDNELDFKAIPSEDLYGITLNDIQTIFKVLKYKYRALFTCQLSALMRIGEMVQLKKKHLNLEGKNIIVNIPPTIAKFQKGRITFFSKEASQLIRPLLKNLDDEDLIFATNPIVHNAEMVVEQVLRRAIVKVGLGMRYETNQRFMINTHGFRAYGITKISRHDPNFAKKIAGQKGYLLQYDRISNEEKLELYEKHEIDLLIDREVINKAEIKKLIEEKQQIADLRTVEEIRITEEYEKMKIKLENIQEEHKQNPKPLTREDIMDLIKNQIATTR